MAKATRTTGEHLYLASVISDRMTVWAVLDFADALRELGVPLKEHVTAHKGNTGSLTHLTVRTQIAATQDDTTVPTPPEVGV